MDLFDILEDHASKLQETGVCEKLESLYGELFGIPFILVDPDGNIITNNECVDSTCKSFIEGSIGSVTVHQPYIVSDIRDGVFSALMGIFTASDLKGFVAAVIDSGNKKFAGSALPDQDSVENFLVKPMAACIQMQCALFEESRANKKLLVKVKHTANTIDVLREQHHEILSENIGQREELEKINEQLEDYGKNLEKKVEERTRELKIAKEKAEEADNLKSQFLANMSHEMRTPLNAIIGFIDVVLEDLNEEKYRQDLLKVERSGHLLLNLVNDILDLSKIEANQLKLESIPLSLEKLLSDSEENARALVKQKEKSIDIRTAIDPSIHTGIIGDPLRLQQVMNNLLSNAVKFTETGYVEAGLGMHIGGENLLFHVTDTGIGIPEDKYDAVFQTFQQADMSTTRKHGGTGLGLTITKKIIELMGGTIWLESRAGEGTTFYFTVPYRPTETVVEDTRAEGKTVEIVSRDEITVLLVEDNIDNQLLAQRMLLKKGYAVLIADDGQEALDTYKASHGDFDIVLMDIQMPRMGGLEATTLIREFEETEGLPRKPIVALTAGAMEGDREQCLRAGCDNYLTKPMKKQALYDTIEAYFSSVDNPE